jgi:hypothetical protein
MGFGLIIGFIEHLQFVTTSKYNAVANSLYHVASHVFSLLYLHRLSPGNGLQRRSFLSVRVRVLTGLQLFHK